MTGSTNWSVEDRAAADGVAAAFDPARLVQGRRLKGLTKTAVASEINVSTAAISHWEAGTHPPRADHVLALSSELDVPIRFFAAGRPFARLGDSDAHFRSLRRTPARERAKAIAFTEQTWELTYALEKRVRLPNVNIPGFGSVPELPPEILSHPLKAARYVRELWGLGEGKISRLVKTLERNGVVVTLVSFAGNATPTVDAFSTSHLPRPVVVLTPERARDVYRHRFTAAHELGHLVMHGETDPGDPQQERDADMFAAEFLTPQSSITPLLPKRLNLNQLDRLSQEWGVGIESLIRRCHEVGTISEAAYRRSFQRLNQLRKLGLFEFESVENYPGELPSLLRQAYEVANENGMSMSELASELALKPKRIRELLGAVDSRPELRIV